MRVTFRPMIAMDSHQQVWLLTTSDPVFRARGLYRHLGALPTGRIMPGDAVCVHRPSDRRV